MNSKLLKRKTKKPKSSLLYHNTRQWTIEEQQQTLSIVTKEKHLAIAEERDIWKINVIEPAGILLLGDGYHVTGPKNIENRSKEFKSPTRDPTGHWFLLVASKEPASKKIWVDAKQKLHLYNQQHPNRKSKLTNLPTDKKTYKKDYENRYTSAIGFVLFREAKEADNAAASVWADDGANHWVVERALPFENPIKDFGSNVTSVRLKIHSRHVEMKAKLIAMLRADLENGTQIKPILDSQLVDHEDGDSSDSLVL